LEKEKSSENIVDIHEAQREYFKSNKAFIIRNLFFISSIFILLTSIFWFRYKNIFIFNSFKPTYDEKVLGHLPYVQISKDYLLEIQPNILVHKDMYESLLKMKDDAEKEGIFLVFLSGYRSIKLQEEIFYSLKAARNQYALERAKVSAPPGYSEHSTGFAIDIGDAKNRDTDFEVEFENTKVFKWLKRNAAKYHFRLSFDKNHNSVDYEPWHWRYEGSIEALRIFEQANREKSIF
tara:strand:+ start:3599 stop:4303 length:705 start_codon:yes stop_codon:yes gene_type:complete